MEGTYYSSVGVFLEIFHLVSVTDVTNHLGAKLLGQHLMRDAHNWHLNTADSKLHKLNRALPFPTLLKPTKTITPFFFHNKPPFKKKKGRSEG